MKSNLILISSCLLFLLLNNCKSPSPEAPTTRPAKSSNTQTTSDIPMLWSGYAEVMGTKLFFVARFSYKEENVFTGTIDIPLQKAKDLPLQDVKISAKNISFTLLPPDAPEEAKAMFTINHDGKSGNGTLEQGGQTFPLKMEVGVKEATLPKRPQTPKEPFPYNQRDVTYQNAKDDTTLAGTLVTPKTTGPHPVALLITGSGSQDRDETIVNHKPFLVLADHLARNGIATLRVDDRGVGGSTGDPATATTLDFVGDVLSGVAWLKQQAEIDPDKIGLIGHSEGGLIAPIAATQSQDIAFIILMAGTGLDGREVLATQSAALLEHSGVPKDDAKKSAKLFDEAISTLGKTAKDDAKNKKTAMKTFVKEQIRIGHTYLGQEKPDNAVVNEQVDALLERLGSPWFRAFYHIDPKEYLSKVTCPVLALNGTLDLQVLFKENLSAIELALKKANNTDVTIVELQGLNHLFQNAKTGLPEEYGSIEETLAPVLLDKISDWIKTRFL